jgi:hypothetical protein
MTFLFFCRHPGEGWDPFSPRGEIKMGPGLRRDDVN